MGENIKVSPVERKSKAEFGTESKECHAKENRQGFYDDKFARILEATIHAYSEALEKLSK